jgi:hypothetical protein
VRCAGDGKCVICDSYVRPATLVRVCDECNYGSYAGRCVICGGNGISDAYYCKECTMQEKDVRAPQRGAQASRGRPALTRTRRAPPPPAERRLSEDCKPGQREDGSILREEKMCAPLAPGVAALLATLWTCHTRLRPRADSRLPLSLSDGFKKR